MQLFLPRFYGFTDEPGVIGTTSTIILLTNRFNLKDRVNIPIFIAGILSFSIVFYGVLFGYVLFLVKPKVKIILLILAISISTYLSENEVFNTLVLNRFALYGGTISGDNRTIDGYDQWYNRFSKTDDYYFGIGKEKAREFNYGGSSYKDLIASYGFIFFLLFISLLIIRAFWFLRLTKEFFVYLLILFAIIYQRPYITSYFYVFLILSPVAGLAYKDYDHSGSYLRNKSKNQKMI